MDKKGKQAYEYAMSLADVLANELSTHVRRAGNDETQATTFAKAFRWHAARVFENYEDLGALLILELYEDNLIGTEIDKQQIHRILTRIRKRLARKIRERQLTGDDEIGYSPNESTQKLGDAIRELTPDEALIAETLLDRRNEKLVMSDLQMSRATFYRARNRVKEKLKKLLRHSE